MGSLTSRPKTPPQPQYVPVYYTDQTAFPQDYPTGQSNSAANSDPDGEELTRRRNASLLERSRGNLSTVLTGFRGVLSRTDTPARKTLLGE